MLRELRRLTSAATQVASIAGIAYLALAVWRVRAFGSRRTDVDADCPLVTVIKPVCGLEPGLYENLRSFCEQDYPSFQVLFGVRDRDDPAIAVIEQLIAALPNRDLTLVVDRRARALNPKVAVLLNTIDRATGDVIIVADSDMRVDPAYLRAVTAPFAGGNVGAVTCLYRGEPVNGTHAGEMSSAWTPSAFGAMFINEQFAPSVLVSLALAEVGFCLGATMAVRREVLERIGGFEALGSQIADDYALGKLVRESGFEVGLSSYVVTNLVHEPDVPKLWLHELRWARTIRAVRPIGYALSGVTHVLPVTALFALLSRNVPCALSLLSIAAALRVSLHYSVRRALRVLPATSPWLIPLRDAFSFGIWMMSFTGRNVNWRERTFTLRSGGGMTSD